MILIKALQLTNCKRLTNIFVCCMTATPPPEGCGCTSHPLHSSELTLQSPGIINSIKHFVHLLWCHKKRSITGWKPLAGRLDVPSIGVMWNNQVGYKSDQDHIASLWIWLGIQEPISIWYWQELFTRQTPAISKVFHGDAELCVVIWDIGLYWGVCMAWDPKSQELKFNWEKHCQVRHGHSWLPSIVAPDEGRTTPRLQGERLGPASKELSSQEKTFLDSYWLLTKIEQTNSSEGRKPKSCMPWGLLLLK